MMAGGAAALRAGVSLPAPLPPAPAAPTPPAPAPLRSWQEMREWSVGLLLSRTGADIAAWNDHIARAGLDDEQALQEWLAGQGVTGYAQALLVWERFGYLDFLTADADQLIAGSMQTARTCGRSSTRSWQRCPCSAR
jgi:hypothetical protein